ncbi:terminal nucleotidyltransferase 4B-like isoform X2 [Phoenix dactylifera]|uniref:polynucleotide adenylyltransferase n=1 Tax=Phoenix dactylifera TaxID=42345 RepID=A0A8B9ABZ4_PHODC|nr:terminal nucleotidyltransferase 4B-like isoform X2 [Phoenix dactylifera]
MEKEGMQGSAGFLYETLDTPFFSADPDSAPDNTESYAVYRNQITSPADSFADVPAADYFSLDVAADNRRREETPPPPPASRASDRNRALEMAWFRAGSRFKSPMFQLHKEILDFCDFVSPTPEEQASRSAAVQRVFEVEVFGSFRTGLYLPTSDIDVVILESKVKTSQMGLYALARALSQRSIAKKMQVIAKARVPIVKFVEKLSGISFDISFDVDSGPKASDFIKDAVKKMPPLRPLCLILKVFLQQRELNEVYSGGIGSYALLAMLIAYLQVHWRGQDIQGCRRSMEHNLGVLLVNFFDFYGRKLNTWDVGVSCNSVGTFFLKSDKGFMNAERPYLLSIEDPQAPDNDIGRNSYNYFKVRSAFAMAYSLLTDTKAIIGLGLNRSILGTIIRPDPVLLERKGGDNGELAFNNLLPGAGEPVTQQFENGSDVIYNWQLVDDEPLPRGRVLADDDCILSSRRRASKAKQRSSKSQKLEVWGGMNEENGVRSARGLRKQWKGSRDGDESTSSFHHHSRRSH